MPDSLTQVSTLNNLLQHFFVPKALMTLYNETPLYEFAVKAPQPKGQGNITYWNAWTRLGGASSVLSEGGSNSTVSLSSRRVSATIAQYGRGYKLTDLSEWVTVLNSMEGAQETLRESAKETLEYVLHMGIYKGDINKNRVKTTNISSYVSSVASAWSANTGTHNGDIQFQFPVILGTSCTHLSGVGTPSLSSQLSLYTIRKAVTKLRSLNTKPMADGKFVGYANARALNSVMKDPAWAQWNQYMNSKETMYKGEVGDIWGVRFISSELLPRYAVNARSVNLVFIFGREAFGITEIDGGLKMFVVRGADSSNPYDTFSYLTYKLTAAAACLNPSAGRILAVHEVA
jgi:N4-gp56 family major capsid protein